ncbi:hypothetical protein Bbelb_445720 [Branchiostoma belcheri]|nr:hypothetical protein Bbelb_445720 [Branchiostoma belcheri]
MARSELADRLHLSPGAFGRHRFEPAISGDFGTRQNLSSLQKNSWHQWSKDKCRPAAVFGSAQVSSCFQESSMPSVTPGDPCSRVDHTLKRTVLLRALLLLAVTSARGDRTPAKIKTEQHNTIHSITPHVTLIPLPTALISVEQTLIRTSDVPSPSQP